MLARGVLSMMTLLFLPCHLFLRNSKCSGFAWPNPTWDEERITRGLLLKFGRPISPHTRRKYRLKGVHHVTMRCAITWLRGQASRYRRDHCWCRYKPTGTGYHRTCASSSGRYSLAYIKSAAAKSRLHDAMNDISADHHFCPGPRFPNVPATMKKEFVPW